MTILRWRALLGIIASVLFTSGGLSQTSTTPVTPSPLLRCLIEVQDSTWAINKGAVVKGSLQNLSGHDLKLTVYPSAHLSPDVREKVQNPIADAGYSSFGNFFHKSSIEQDRRAGAIIQAHPEHIWMSAGGSLAFTTDVANLKWQPDVQNSWNPRPLFTVIPSGAYTLKVSFGIDYQGFQTIESEPLRIIIRNPSLDRKIETHFKR